MRNRIQEQAASLRRLAAARPEANREAWLWRHADGDWCHVCAQRSPAQRTVDINSTAGYTRLCAACLAFALDQAEHGEQDI